MPYSLDLRQKVINFVENGGPITEAAHTLGRGRASIYRWLSRPKLSATKVKSRRRKLDRTYAVPLYMVPKIIIFKILPLYIVSLRKS
jgi:transposase